jgi:TetR/AcrR family transcriptional repressor of nem operon
MDTVGGATDAYVRWTRKGQARRDRIVEAAAVLMYERGVASTSTQDILTSAEVSNSQLYHYFEDKTDLTRAVVAYQVERIVGNQETLLARLDSLAALQAWRDAVVSLASRRGGRGGCPVGSLARELSDLDETARERLCVGFERWETAIRAGLVAMRDRGELRADSDPGQLALVILVALQGGLLLSQTRRDITPLATGLDAAITHVRTFVA